MATRQREFVNRVYNEARAAGLPDAQARLAASQAALETNYGKSSVGNNYFGIKAGKSWAGPSVSANTWEDYGNGPVRERANFRAYSDPTQSFRDWASVVGRKWSGALSAPTLSDAVENLNYGKENGYATDRAYGNKIRYIDRNFGPDSYPTPKGSIPTPTSAPDIQGILSGATATPVNSVLNSYTSAAPMAVQRETLAPVGFDNARFGDPIFDAGRFAPPASTTYTPGQLKTALEEQAAMAQPSVQAPSIQNATVQAPTPQQMATNSLLSMPEQRAVAAQKAYLEAQPARAVSALSKLNLGNVLGTVGGSLLGGLALGPLGAVAGGYLGNKVSNAIIDQPPAPKSQPKGDGSMTSYGRSVANSSSQFSRALASGGKGLY